MKETRSGYEIEKSKTIYTKNPFPYLIQKTVSEFNGDILLALLHELTFLPANQVIRDKELIFVEVQRLNMKQKIAQYW